MNTLTIYYKNEQELIESDDLQKLINLAKDECQYDDTRYAVVRNSLGTQMFKSRGKYKS